MCKPEPQITFSTKLLRNRNVCSRGRPSKKTAECREECGAFQSSRGSKCGSTCFSCSAPAMAGSGFLGAVTDLRRNIFMSTCIWHNQIPCQITPRMTSVIRKFGYKKICGYHLQSFLQSWKSDARWKRRGWYKTKPKEISMNCERFPLNRKPWAGELTQSVSG